MFLEFDRHGGDANRVSLYLSYRESRMDPSLTTFAEYLSYDRSSGKILWRKSPGQRVKAGDDAGRIEVNGRRSITFLGVKYTAARVAWFLHYGEWPECSVIFKDRDVTNLRLENLAQSGHRGRRGNPVSQNPLEAQRDRDLRKSYGITLVEYRKMAEDQGNCCAICQKPESYQRNGMLKVLSVDHCHNSMKTRELLCAACNHMLGNARDNSETLRAAADYLDRHAVPAGDLTHV